MIRSETIMAATSSISIGERQRKSIDPYDLGELALSIAQNGLIHNIVISETGALIAGERRLKAFMFLHSRGDNCQFPEYENWTKIPCRVAVDVQQHELEMLELEENIKRCNLPWQEEAQAVVKLHALKQSQDPEWIGADTARLLSVDTGKLYRWLSVGRAIEGGDEVIKKSSSFSSAVGKLSRRTQRAIDSEIGAIDEIENPSIKQETTTRVVFNEEFSNWLKTYSGPRFNFLHCDFPYGVNMDKSEQGNNSGLDTYADTPELYFSLISTLLDNWDRLMLPSSHIMFWFSMNFYQETIALFAEREIFFNPFPLIWFKSDNTGILPDPTRGPRRVYETCFFAATGDRQIVQPVANLYAAPVQKIIHVSEKSESMLRHFMRMFVDSNSIVLDPTCGSGTALRAADSLGAKLVIGLEVNPDYASQAEEAIQKQRKIMELAKP